MKTGFHKRAITMQVLAHADCPRCDSSVTTERPNCGNCSLWLPWGDEVVAQKREARRREFIAQELQEEREWSDARAHPLADAPSRKVVPHFNARHFALPAAVGCSFVFGVVVSSFVSGQSQPTARELRQTNELRRVASDREPTGVCKDGTETYAQSRVGACSGHGGVVLFYK